MKKIKEEYTTHFNQIKPDPQLLNQPQKVKSTPWRYGISLALVSLALLIFIQPQISKFIHSVSTPNGVQENKPTALQEGTITTTEPQKLSVTELSKLVASTHAKLIQPPESFEKSNEYTRLQIEYLDHHYQIYSLPSEQLTSETNRLNQTGDDIDFKTEVLGDETWILVAPQGQLSYLDSIFEEYKNQEILTITQDNLVKTVNDVIESLHQSRKFSFKQDYFHPLHITKDLYIFKLRYTVDVSGLDFPMVQDGIVYDLVEQEGRRYVLVGSKESMPELKIWLDHR